MRHLSVADTAKKWNISERSVRNYCAQGRVEGAFLAGKTWRIPENAVKPERSNKKVKPPTTLLDILQDEKTNKYSGGIYHKTQIDLTYNSNHMEGSRLTHDQTRYIFETNTIGIGKEVLNVDDVIETANHFRCIDKIIDHAKATLSEKFIKELHLILKNGTSDSRKDGRVGRLIMFKECLKYNIVPFIIEDNLKMFYYRGLKEWDEEKGYLMDSCLTAQDRYKAYLDYFRIEY